MSRALRPDLSGVDPLVVNLTHRVCLGDLPTRAARSFGDRVALVDGGSAVTYRELESRSNALARGLQTRGYGRGDAIALQLQNRWEFVVSLFACAKLGVVAMPLNLLLAPGDVAYQLGDSGVRAVITEDVFAPALTAALGAADHRVEAVYIVANGGGVLPAEVGGVPSTAFADLPAADDSVVETIVEDRDILHCLYTSGTTARPKGVVTSHVAVHISALSSAVALGVRPDVEPAVQPIALPLFHVTALDALLMPMLVTGGTAVLLRGFDPAALAGAFVDHRVTHLTLLPMMWAALLTRPELTDENTASLLTGLYAMAPMPAELLTALRARFPGAAIILGSGQTETTPASEVQWTGHQGVKDDSWGPATVSTDVAIMGDDGALLPPGEVGEIVYRAPQLMEGYWNNAAANTEAFAHGWFHGGDIGYLDDEGVVYFTDRAKDIIKSGGENVSSVEVERVLLGHDAVAEVAVVGTPHERWGEAVTAFVVTSPSGEADGDALLEYARQNLAGFKAPKEIVFVDALPKTATGKIQKNLVRTLRETRT
ncbi:class I adenylate-forming enzyme family protein [Tsukamurella ocularis]|uniref:class I adenylate-forming enzyme family protein n=1 Tax=Tsukamurella ocularis TaxID=1970234 RepID=UPI002169CF2A|nr:AMP-binding protein [Tsukamurella ocularis]MCS3779936.1 acyl-CoA synthetase (AMP-forming)/AMP-acid ligase II [Tsukamurella ocularis]MCS3788664.1 acyl-CoA synthetase (AMP-forming)/AMP-acid ligase II [Tsukamurella ocularis]MCS3849874.1 acyl-CoA synthetase (AMP-forming)/AMP-acid ligase II [Tsukamurella ocularis]